MLRRLSNIYHYLISRLLYTPFIKGAKGLTVISPYILTRSCLHLGSSVYIGHSARIEGVPNYRGQEFFPEIHMGNEVSIQQGLHLTCGERITIGDNTAIGANVTITDIDHPYTDISIPIEKAQIKTSPVSIGCDCKIYNNAVILPGVSIGKHCVVAANAVLTRSIEDYTVAAGIPAKPVKKYCFVDKVWKKV